VGVEPTTKRIGTGDSELKVSLNDQLIDTLQVNVDDLYTVIQGTKYDKNTLSFEIYGSGFKLYTFTFG